MTKITIEKLAMQRGRWTIWVESDNRDKPINWTLAPTGFDDSWVTSAGKLCCCDSYHDEFNLESTRNYRFIAESDGPIYLHLENVSNDSMALRYQLHKN